jgi:hypothetical protein
MQRLVERFDAPAFSAVLRVPVVAALVAVFVLAGCGGSGDESGDASEDGPAVTIEQGERSPAISGAKARFAAPSDGEVVDAGSEVMVTVEVDSFETGIQTDTPRREAIANSGNGQHVHIIVDGDPYYANYEPGSPFGVGSLSEGAHTAVVFPSRSYHESVKNPGAMDFVNFYVGEEAGEFPLDPEAPTIIYSRPKGSYSGAGAQRIMMDFYLHNVELGEDGYKAHYEIRKKGSDEVIAETTLTEWVPSFVEGLEKGTYVFHLELLDADGNVVPGPLNTTDREVTVDPSMPDNPEENAM